MFYPEQKVVYVGESDGKGWVNNPKHGDVIRLKRRSNGSSNLWVVYGYEFSPDGLPQAVSEVWIRPLLDDSQEYADKLIKELETEINEEILITV